jgi:hypothetical protein
MAVQKNRVDQGHLKTPSFSSFRTMRSSTKFSAFSRPNLGFDAFKNTQSIAHSVDGRKNAPAKRTGPHARQFFPRNRIDQALFERVQSVIIVATIVLERRPSQDNTTTIPAARTCKKGGWLAMPRCSTKKNSKQRCWTRSKSRF